METRYRQRYLTSWPTPETREVFVRRSRMVSEIRRFLDERGFLEVETPILQPIYGGGRRGPLSPTTTRWTASLYLAHRR